MFPFPRGDPIGPAAAAVKALRYAPTVHAEALTAVLADPNNPTVRVNGTKKLTVPNHEHTNRGMTFNGMVRCLYPSSSWDIRDSQRGRSMELHTIGIDLGKTVFHLVGLNLRDEVVVRKKFSRAQLGRLSVQEKEAMIGGFKAIRLNRRQKTFLRLTVIP